MSEHEHDEECDHWDLVMPFVVCEDNGGPYDPPAFVSGVLFGRAWKALSVGEEWSGNIYEPMVAQYDLLAMKYDAEMVVEELPTEPPSSFVKLVPRR